jgi:hypothetical protein
MGKKIKDFLALTSPTSGGRSVGKVRLRIKVTKYVLFYVTLD